MRMKTSAEQRTSAVPVPPLALRQWDDPSWREDPAQLGAAVYGTREAWLGARQEWAATHGLTVQEWFGLACDDALVRGGLDGMNAMFSGYLTEPDDWEGDPRRLTDGQLAERRDAQVREAQAQRTAVPLYPP